ncbi:hypothetical protein C8Q78DRAFT_637810 [Trametes maxima]|nr:hypothetical protein C8Q78DRAFT_637810 [Trametes maxima]
MLSGYRPLMTIRRVTPAPIIACTRKYLGLLNSDGLGGSSQMSEGGHVMSSRCSCAALPAALISECRCYEIRGRQRRPPDVRRPQYFSGTVLCTHLDLWNLGITFVGASRLAGTPSCRHASSCRSDRVQADRNLLAWNSPLGPHILSKIHIDIMAWTLEDRGETDDKLQRSNGGLVFGEGASAKPRLLHGFMQNRTCMTGVARRPPRARRMP